MTIAETDDMAECLRWLYVESHCKCRQCKETRIRAARALAIYESERRAWNATAREAGTRQSR